MDETPETPTTLDTTEAVTSPDTPPTEPVGVTLLRVPGGRVDLAATVTEAGAAGRRIRLALQPRVLFDGRYFGWRGVSWIVEVPTAEAACGLRDAIDGAIRAWVESQR